MAISNPKFELIPSAKKVGKLYSPIPSNGDGDFTFTRTTEGVFTNKDGYLETAPIDAPRLDYRDTKCPELLLEEASTNFMLYSEDFSNSNYYTKNSSSYTLTQNSSIAPDGKNTASLFEFISSIMSAGMFCGNSNRPTVSALGEVWTTSIFVKYVNGASDLKLSLNGSGFSGSSYAFFDIENGTVTSENLATGKIEDYGNGWFRCSVTATSTASGVLINTFYANTSTELGSRYYWGVQSEKQATATSYIKTTASATLRGADVCDGAGTVDTFNSSEGVLYAEMSSTEWNGVDAYLSISDGTTSNRIYLSYSSSTFSAVVVIATVDEVVFSIPLASLGDVTDMNKIAIKYKQNDCALWINGVEVDSDLSTTALLPSDTLTTFGFDDGVGSNSFYGRVKNIKVYDTALTDAELTELTQ